MRGRRLLTVVLACALAFAACGGDDDDDAAAKSASASPADDQASADAAIAAFKQQLKGDGFDPEHKDSDSQSSDTTAAPSGDNFQFESAECQFLKDTFPQSGDEFP